MAAGRRVESHSVWAQRALGDPTGEFYPARPPSGAFLQMLHPIRRLLLAEKLTLLRRSTAGRRYAAAQRSGTIDANPHQVEAVIFALRRVREGGCILADEVGLGKTIEAGLVIAQLRAEGARRVLLVTPKPLLGQWRQELSTLFGIEARELTSRALDPEGEGVFLAGRELLASDRAFERLRAAEAFDLCVVDEAHEVFAGIHRRFDRAGQYLPHSSLAVMAGRLRSLLRAGHTPTVLLTATPLSNSLAELWGLVHFVDPSGTLLGQLGTFRQLFCQGDDRQLREGQERELQRRLRGVLQRSLRRQAQEFIRQPFVGRRARLFEYSMGPEERALYDDVTRYLLRPNVAAFSGPGRRLLLLGFHRRMASSHRALEASLGRVAQRLEGMLAGAREPDSWGEDAEELEDDWGQPEEAEAPAAHRPPDIAAVALELELVRGFLQRLQALPADPKAVALLDAVRLIQKGDEGRKLVLFTESLATQQYLRELLAGSGLLSDRDITLFRGVNDSQRAHEALERYLAEVPGASEAALSRDVAMRQALVHEFRTRTRVLISTEAGAKGLNLQFCDTIINYDLPWNPQRLEQRIGRCHRYGQVRDVTVINFLARDNAAQQLTFEILSRKLELFGAVLDASDRVLFEPAEGGEPGVVDTLCADFASHLSQIYERARSLEQIEAELAQLGREIEGRRQAKQEVEKRTRSLIDTRFDSLVRRAFRSIERELPRRLAELDDDLEELLTDYLQRLGVSFRRQVLSARQGEGPARVLLLEAHPELPEGLRGGGRVFIGRPPAGAAGPPVNLNHPFVKDALRAAREPWGSPPRIRVRPADPALDARGRRGKLSVVKLDYPGTEPVQHLLVVALPEGSTQAWPPGLSERLLSGAIEDADVSVCVDEALMQEAIDEAVFLDERAVAQHEQRSFERAMMQIERFVEDRRLVLLQTKSALSRRLEEAQKQRVAAAGAELRQRAQRGLEAAAEQLEQVEQELARLARREDSEYLRLRELAYARRFSPPSKRLLVQAEFVVE